MTTKEFNEKYLLGREKADSFGSAFGILLPFLPPIKCEDGFEVSVQAGAGIYCTPREGLGPWTHVECGYPSGSVPEWLEWREGDVDTETVFGYVPLEVVLKTFEAHGGIKEDSQ